MVLDVVYNHTGESDETGPTYSYKGIDNSTYYIATREGESIYGNWSGTGNTLHCSNGAVRDDDRRQPAILGDGKITSTVSALILPRCSPATPMGR